jgi:hypothetical protein
MQIAITTRERILNLNLSCVVSLAGDPSAQVQQEAVPPDGFELAVAASRKDFLTQNRARTSRL